MEEQTKRYLVVLLCFLVMAFICWRDWKGHKNQKLKYTPGKKRRKIDET